MTAGAASGIGKATAERLRADGQKVIGVDLRGADLTADLSAAEGRATIVEQVSALSDGHVDAVIAVAGLFAPSPITISVNYFGAKAAIEGLRHPLVRSEAPEPCNLRCTPMMSRKLHHLPRTRWP